MRSIGAVVGFLAGCNEYAFPAPGNDGSINQPSSTISLSDEPVADAGSDQAYSPRSLVLLDGSESVDPRGGAITAYEWTLVSVPNGSEAELSDPADARPSVFLDLTGTYVFELTVQNEDGYWDMSPDRVQLVAVPETGLYVEVTWDQTSDLDLHLLEESGPPFSGSDCTWCNPNPSWGQNGPLNDPLLEVNSTRGFGPEAVSIPDPEYGTSYTIAVHYYGDDGDPACVGKCERSVAVVRVFIDGSEAGLFAQQLATREDFWTAAVVHWPGNVVEANTVVTVATTGCSF